MRVCKTKQNQVLTVKPPVKRKILKLTSVFLLTVQISALLIAFPLSTNFGENEVNNPDFIDQTSLLNDDNIQSSDTKGLIETLNFIPLDGERFSHSLSGYPLWTYPSPSSYVDTFWGNGITNTQNITADQIWNPESGQIVSTDSIPPSASTDFDDWDVGSVTLDAARRDREFNPNDVDMNATTLELTESGASVDAASYITAVYSNDPTVEYYPDVGEPLNTETATFVRSGDDIVMDFSQYTWWDELYNPNKNSYTVDLNWEVTLYYTTQFEMKFYYEDTSTSTIANYGVDAINFANIGSIGLDSSDADGWYDNNIYGNISYVIKYENGTTVPGTDSGLRNFTTEYVDTEYQIIGENEFLGTYDYDIDSSGDFGSYLEDGLYTYQINVVMTHTKTGSYSWTGSRQVDIDESYTEDIGVQMTILNPKVSISESTPIQVLGQDEVLIVSDWVNWGEDREVYDDTPVMSFGYQIPDELIGVDGASETLENARTYAMLEIDYDLDDGSDYTFTQAATNNFSDVRGVDSGGYGYGCDKFIWDLNSTIEDALNNSVRIRWSVGIQIDTGLELGYDTGVKSRVYFNNINFTVQTRIKIQVTFTVKNILNQVEYSNDIYFKAEHSTNGDTFYATKANGEGTAVFDTLYNGTWIITANKSALSNDGTTKIVDILHTLYTLNTGQSIYADDLVCDLTNVNYTVKDQFGDLLFDDAAIQNAYATFTSISNPTDTYTREISEVNDSTVYMEELYDGDWQVILTITRLEGAVPTNFTIANYTKSFSITNEYPDSQYKFFFTADLQLTAGNSLNNLILNVTDPTNGLAVVDNTQIDLYDIDDPAFSQTEYTADGNVTFSELYNGNWGLVVTSVNGFVIYNSTFEITSPDFVLYKEIMYNLTNLELEFVDYKGNALDEIDYSYTVYLSNAETGASYSESLVNGNVTFNQILNGSAADSWQLVVDVSYTEGTHTIYNNSMDIRTNLDVIYSSYTINLTTIELTIYDIDSELVENAEIILKNLDSSEEWIDSSDSSGNVVFREVYEGNWELKVNYTVGEGAFVTKEYEIKFIADYTDISLSTVGDTGYSFLLQKDIIDSNLTTVDFYVYDSALAASTPEYAGLNAANITISNNTSGVNENITTLLTDANGYVQIKLPATTYNVSMEHQGGPKTFKFNGTGDLDEFRLEHEKTISDISDSPVYLLVSSTGDELTRISIDDFSFAETGSTWAQGNGQKTQFSTLPHYLYMYYNDSVELSFNYQGTNPVSNLDADTGTWTISKDGDTKNESSNMASLRISEGYYNLSIFSQDYKAGTYVFSITLNGGSGYVPATYDFTLYILNHSTSLTLLSDNAALTENWGEILSLEFEYETIVPLVATVYDATVSFSIEGTTYTDISLNETAGIYTLNFTSQNLDVGSYALTIYAEAGNVTAKTLIVGINVISVLTDSAHSVENASDYVRLAGDTSSSMKVALGESFTIFFNYTLGDTGLLGNIGDFISSGTTATAILTGWSTPDQTSKIQLDSGTSLYNFTADAADYSVGTYTLTITLSNGNYTTQTFTVEITILDTWGTNTDLISPPDPTLWSNNASFIIQYFADESPRSLDLTGATISQLEITYTVDSTEYTLVVLDDTSPYWTYEELIGTYGEGFYNITLNTSIFTVDQARTLCIKPSISSTLYTETSLRAYIYVIPVGTEAELTVSGESLSSYTMYVDESLTFQAQISVIDSDSVLLGNYLEDVIVTYTVYNASDLGQQFSQVQGITLADGTVAFTIDGEVLDFGAFIVKVTYTYQNYTQSQVSSFSLNIDLRPSTYTVTINSDQRLSSAAIKVAYGETINFTLIFDDVQETYPDLTATVNGITMDKEVLNLEFGYYRYTLPANTSNFVTTGSYIIEITGPGGSNVQTLNLDLEILDYWDTSMIVVVPPMVYSWNNISEYIVKYYCSDQPRSGIMLDGATITNIDLYYEGEVVATLDDSNLNTLWTWTDLISDPSYGAGYYRITFNTSILSVTSMQVFQAKTYINHTIYRQASVDPNVWVEPVTSAFSLEKDGTGVSNLYVLYGSDDNIVNATLEVIDSTSALYGEVVTGASVFFDIYNETQDLVYSGSLTEFGANLGTYWLDLDSTVTNSIGIGSFTVEIDMVLDNYTLSQLASFTLIVNDLSISTGFSGDLTADGTLTQYQGENWNITILLFDETNNFDPLIGATVMLEFTDPVYSVEITDLDNDGVYSLDISWWTTLQNYFTTDGTFIGTVTATKDNYVTDISQVTVILNNRTFSRVFMGDFSGAQLTEYKEDDWNLSVQVMDHSFGDAYVLDAEVIISVSSLGFSETLFYIGNGVYTSIISWDDVKALFTDGTFQGTLEITNDTFTSLAENIGITIINRTLEKAYAGDFDNNQMIHFTGDDWNFTIQLLDATGSLTPVTGATVIIEIEGYPGTIALLYTSDGYYFEEVSWATLSAYFGTEGNYIGNITIVCENYTPIFEVLGFTVNDRTLSLTYGGDFAGAQTPQLSRYKGEDWNLTVVLADLSRSSIPLTGATVLILFDDYGIPFTLSEGNDGIYTYIVDWASVESSFEDGIYYGVLTITKANFETVTASVVLNLNNRTFTIVYLGDFENTQMTKYKTEDWNFTIQLLDASNNNIPINTSTTVTIEFPTVGSSGTFILSYIPDSDGIYTRIVTWDATIEADFADSFYSGILSITKENYTPISQSIGLALNDVGIEIDYSGDLSGASIIKLKGENWYLSIYTYDGLSFDPILGATVSLVFPDFGDYTIVLMDQNNGTYSASVSWDLIKSYFTLDSTSTQALLTIETAAAATITEYISTIVEAKTISYTLAGDMVTGQITVYKGEDWDLTVVLEDASNGYVLLPGASVELAFGELPADMLFVDETTGYYTYTVDWYDVESYFSSGTFQGTLTLVMENYQTQTVSISVVILNRTFLKTYDGDFESPTIGQISTYFGDDWLVAVNVYDASNGDAPLSGITVKVSFDGFVLPYTLVDQGGGLYSVTLNWLSISGMVDSRSTIQGVITISNTSTFTTVSENIAVLLSNRTFSITYMGDFDQTQINKFKGDDWNLTIYLFDLSRSSDLTTATVSIYLEFMDATYPMAHIGNGVYQYILSWDIIKLSASAGTSSAELSVISPNFASQSRDIAVVIQNREFDYVYTGDIVNNQISKFLDEDWQIDLDIYDVSAGMVLTDNAIVTLSFAFLPSDITNFVVNSGSYSKFVSWDTILDGWVTKGTFVGTLTIEDANNLYTPIVEDITLIVQERTFSYALTGDFVSNSITVYKGDSWNFSVEVFDSTGTSMAFEDANVYISFSNLAYDITLLHETSGHYEKLVEWINVQGDFDDGTYIGTLYIEDADGYFTAIEKTISITINNRTISTLFGRDFDGPRITTYQSADWNLSISLFDESRSSIPLIGVTYLKLVFPDLADYEITFTDSNSDGIYEAFRNWAQLDAAGLSGGSYDGTLIIIEDEFTPINVNIAVAINNQSIQIIFGGDIDSETQEVIHYVGEDWNITINVNDITGDPVAIIDATVNITFGSLDDLTLTLDHIVSGRYSEEFDWNTLKDDFLAGTFQGKLSVRTTAGIVVTEFITFTINPRIIFPSLLGDFDGLQLIEIREDDWYLAVQINDTTTAGDPGVEGATITLRFTGIDDVVGIFDDDGNGLYTKSVDWNILKLFFPGSSYQGVLRIVQSNFTTVTKDITLLLQERTLSFTLESDFDGAQIIKFREEIWILAVNLVDVTGGNVDLLGATVTLSFPSAGTDGYSFTFTETSNGYYNLTVQWSTIESLFPDSIYSGVLTIEKVGIYSTESENIGLTLQNRVMQLELLEDLTSGQINQFRGIDWNLEIFLEDISSGSLDLSGATVTLTFSTIGYQIILEDKGNGIYNKSLTWTSISSLFVLNNYQATLTVSRDNFVSLSENIALILQNRIIDSDFSGDISQGGNLEKYLGESWNLVINVTDITGTSFPLEGATCYIYIPDLDLSIDLYSIESGIYGRNYTWSLIEQYFDSGAYEAELVITKPYHESFTATVNIFLAQRLISMEYLGEISAGGLLTKYLGDDIEIRLVLIDESRNESLTGATVFLQFDISLGYEFNEIGEGAYRIILDWVDIRYFFTSGLFDAQLTVDKTNFETLTDTFTLNLRERTIDFILGDDFDGNTLLNKFYGEDWIISVDLYDISREYIGLEDADVTIYFPDVDKTFILYATNISGNYYYEVHWDNVDDLFTESSYDGILTITCTNFATITRAISLELETRSFSIEYLGDFQSISTSQIIVEKGYDWNITLQLFDQSRGGIPLVGASITVRFENPAYQFILSDDDGDGVYNRTVDWDSIKDLFVEHAGDYLGEIIMIKEYFNTQTIGLGLTIDYREIGLEFQGGFDEDSPLISEKKGDSFEFEIQLIDNRTRQPITDAEVFIYFEDIDFRLNLTYTDNGTYVGTANFADIKAFTNDASFSGVLTIVSDNYDFADMTIFVNIEMEEAIAGIPTFYLIIGIAGVVILVGSIGAYKTIEYARIPALIKVINKLEGQIAKGAMVSDDKLARSLLDIVTEEFGDAWEMLDLDPAKQLASLDQAAAESSDLANSPRGGF